MTTGTSGRAPAAARGTSQRAAVVAISLLLLAAAAAGCAAGPEVDADPGAEDRRITAEVLRIIAEDDDIVAEDIEVETRDGVVTLSGIQPAIEPLADILQRVARVRGVTQVVNQIRIVRASRFVPTPTARSSR